MSHSLLVNSSDNSGSIPSDEKGRGKIVFKVRKGDFYDDILKEQDKNWSKNEEKNTDNESETSVEIKGTDDQASSNRISAFSKVNFSKLNAEEKDLRLKNLAKIVKHLRKKIRSYETKNEELQKLPNNFSKTDKLTKNAQKKLINNVLKAHTLLKTYLKNNNDKEKNYIDIFFELIVNNKLKFDSIYFKNIIAQIEKCAKDSENSQENIAKRNQNLNIQNSMKGPQNQQFNYLNIFQDKGKSLIINFNNNNHNNLDYKYNSYPQTLFNNISNSSQQNKPETLNLFDPSLQNGLFPLDNSLNNSILEFYKQNYFLNYTYNMNSYNPKI